MLPCNQGTELLSAVSMFGPTVPPRRQGAFDTAERGWAHVGGILVEVELAGKQAWCGVGYVLRLVVQAALSRTAR